MRDQFSGGGLGFVADVRGRKSHDIIEKGIQVLINLAHRGACGCDPETGDGAGILIQIPHQFFAREASNLGFSLPEPGEYGVGMVFLPVERQQRLQAEGIIERIIREEGLGVLGWRDMPTYSDAIGRVARGSQPYIEQMFVGGAAGMSTDELERRLYIVRKRAEKEVAKSELPDKGTFYIPSFSARTIVYKGLLLAPQIATFYRELSDPDLKSAICLVYQSFGGLPIWSEAQPCRYVCHNGSFTAVRGNVNWMDAREPLMSSAAFGGDLRKLFPVVEPSGTDSMCFDNVVELLARSGRTLQHAIAMLIPEAWDLNPDLSPPVRAFYEYHSSLIEPWDGPAAVTFTDGRVVGAALDRNGLRPVRYAVTKDGLVVLSSEAGVLPIRPEDISRKGRLQPGQMLLVDLEAGRIIADEEIKQQLASGKPYREWLDANQLTLEHLPEPPRVHGPDYQTVLVRQRIFGYTQEDLKTLIGPMAESGEEPIGSMGLDTPLACLSDQPQLLFNYFKQLFAQVANPPIDPIREEMVMSLVSYLGAERNLLDETPEHCHTIKLRNPVITNRDLEKLRRVSQGDFLAATIPALYPVDDGERGLERNLETMCRRASLAIQDGYTILVLSDRGIDEQYAPIPSLLALTAVHNHLVREGTRTQVAIIIESGEPREAMHFASLIGYGACAVNPYLAIETIGKMAIDGALAEGLSFEQAIKNYVKAVNRGLLRVFSKAGISTLQSYRGAQAFEAIGLNSFLIEKYFTGTTSRLEGIGLEVIARDAAVRHAQAFPPAVEYDPQLRAGGNFTWRAGGEYHLLNPSTISTLRRAVRGQSFPTFQEFTDAIDEQNERLCTIRGLLGLKTGAPVPMDEVEPATEIVKRFGSAAISFGSVSKEAHETLAMAMNRIGARSNSGEGGEEESRFVRGAESDLRRSAVKQVASGRFGVTVNYLVNAETLEIKMAQGSNPGEGGLLPAGKVDESIARVRNTVPGVSLISPPANYDVYSIEDLAQLIYDLKNVNPQARIAVKLAAESGVGTVAAGVAKAHADVILISGHDGGTGASPLTSLRYAGSPWELGLAETQQVLVMNDLRSRVRLQNDGKLLTGRDVAIAALLGAEEFGFGTAPLIAMGCVMTRNCHRDACPVGIATQNPVLRARFAGQPEHVINYFLFVAEQVRNHMAQLGFRRMDEMIGRVDKLEARPALEHWKAKGLDFSGLLYNVPAPSRIGRRSLVRQDHGLDAALDYKLIDHARESVETGRPIVIKLPIRNTHRSVGAMLSGAIARKHGDAGLPDDTIRFEFTGSAGQSFGAFLARGVTFVLEGEVNDFAGKGLSGGRLTVRPPVSSTFAPDENVLAGNVALYGATSGEAFFNGIAGERFAVRNSGALAVVEGVGDHGCEYMTKGAVVVLGRTGRNFAAGMSGGIAYVFDESGTFTRSQCNKQWVDLEPVAIAEEQDVLRGWILRHFEATGSPRAARILDKWDEALPKFVKVFPREFKRLLGQQGRTFPESHESAPPRREARIEAERLYPIIDVERVFGASQVIADDHQVPNTFFAAADPKASFLWWPLTPNVQAPQRTEVYLIFRDAAPRAEELHDFRNRFQMIPIPISLPRMIRALEENRPKELLFSIRSRYLDENPYHYRIAMSDADPWFFGRTDYLDRLPSAILASRHLGIFGLRKVGKTCLLNRLQDRLARNTPVVLLDLGRNTAGGSFRRILTEMRKALSSRIARTLPPGSGGFGKQWMELREIWRETGSVEPFVLMLDEADKLFPDRRDESSAAMLRATVVLFRKLRSLAQEGHGISLVLCSYRASLNRHNLLGLAGEENPIHMSLDEVFLRYLNREETRRMIRDIGLWMGVEWSDEATDRVYELLAGHPFLTRLFASDACDKGARKSVEITHVQELARSISGTFSSHAIRDYFRESMWDILDTDERECLRVLASGSRTRASLRDARVNLEQFGIIDEQGAIQGSLYQQWVRGRQ